MKSLIKRVINLESDCKECNTRFYLLFINAAELPYLTRGIGREPMYFSTHDQFLRFREIADTYTPEQNGRTVIFPVYFSGDPEPLPEKRKVITSWTLDLSEITAKPVTRGNPVNA